VNRQEVLTVLITRIETIASIECLSGRNLAVLPHGPAAFPQRAGEFSSPLAIPAGVTDEDVGHTDLSPSVCWQYSVPRKPRPDIYKTHPVTARR
jgi:hypothetical protein